MKKKPMGKYLIYCCVSVLYLVGVPSLAQNKLKAGNYEVGGQGFSIDFKSGRFFVKDKDSSKLVNLVGGYEVRELAINKLGKELLTVFTQELGAKKIQQFNYSSRLLAMLTTNRAGQIITVNYFVPENTKISLKQLAKISKHIKEGLLLDVSEISEHGQLASILFPIRAKGYELKVGNYQVGGRKFTVANIRGSFSIMDDRSLNYVDLPEDKRFKLSQVHVNSKESFISSFREILKVNELNNLKARRHLDIEVTGYIDNHGNALVSNFYLPMDLNISVLQLSKISNLIQKEVKLQVPDDISEDKVGSFTYNLPIKSLEE